MTAAPMEAARRTLAPLRELFPFEPRFLETPGGWLHYVDEGPRNAPVILALHGNPTWSFIWRRVIARFAGERRVVALDHLGCGLSQKPKEWSYRLADHVANVERLVLDLDLRDVTLLVHDWGGAIGMGFATRHPERIARLLVTNGAAFPGGRMPRRIALCRTPLLGELVVRGLNGFARAATVMAVQRRLDPQVRAGLLAPYRDWASRIALHRFVLDIPTDPGQPSFATLADIDAGLARLAHKPLSILWGERDWCFTPAFRSEWLKRFPKADVSVLGAAGHYLFEDEPEAFVDHLARFLEEPLSRPLEAPA